MVDREKLRKDAEMEPTLPGDSEKNQESDQEPNLIIKIPEVDSSKESVRAWIVRLIASVFALGALYVFYLAYKESAKLRDQESQLQTKINEYEELTNALPAMREESRELNREVEKLTRENNQLSFDLQKAQGIIAEANQKELEMNQFTRRHAKISADLIAIQEQSLVKEKEIQSLEARRKAEIENLDNLLETIDENLKILAGQQDVLNEVKMLRMERNALTERVDRLKGTREEFLQLTKEVTVLEAKKNQIEPEIAELSSLRDIAQGSLDEVSNILIDAQQEHAMLKVRLDGDNKTLNQTKLEIESRISQTLDLREEISSLDARKRELVEEVGRLKSMSEERKRQIEHLRQEEKDLDDRRFRLIPEVEELSEKLMALKETLSRNEEKQKNLEEENQAQNKEQKNLISEIEELSDNLNELNLNFDQAQADNLKLADQKESLEREVQELSSENESLANDAEALNTKLNALKLELTRAQADQKSLDVTIVETQKRKELLESQEKELIRKIEQLRVQVSQLQNSADENRQILKEEIQTRKNQRKNLESGIEELSNNLGGLKIEVNKAREENLKLVNKKESLEQEVMELSSKEESLAKDAEALTGNLNSLYIKVTQAQADLNSLEKIIEETQKRKELLEGQEKELIMRVGQLRTQVLQLENLPVEQKIQPLEGGSEQ